MIGLHGFLSDISNTVLITWFKGKTNNDYNAMKTFNLPYSYTTYYSISAILLPSSIDYYNGCVWAYNKTLTTVKIHYTMSSSVAHNIAALTVGY